MIRLALLATALLAAGCQARSTAPFPQGDGTLVWPAPPDTPRIRWVGQLTGEESLGAPRRIGLRELVAGPKPRIAFSAPNGIAVRNQRVLVSDGQLGVVHDLDLNAKTYRSITTAAGQLLEGPIDVVWLDDGHFAVADSRRAAVFVFSSDGTYRQTIGAGTLERPAGLAWDARQRRLLVSDAAAHQVLAFSAEGRALARAGQRGAGRDDFNFPAGIAYRAPWGLAVADAMNFRVHRRPDEGSPLVFGKKGDAAGDFALPRAVAFDSAGHLYVVDSQFEAVQIFDDQGRLLLAFGREGTGPGNFSLPSGIAIDEQDRIWVADTYNRRVQCFQYLREEVGP